MTTGRQGGIASRFFLSELPLFDSVEAALQSLCGNFFIHQGTT